MTEPHEQHGLIELEGTCLVLVDMQEKLFPVMTDRDRLLENTLRLTRAADILGLPVVLTEQIKLGPTLAGIMESLPGADPIEKSSFNAFHCDSFRERIKSLAPRNMVLTGIEAHICVAQTALHALPDLRVHVVSDAVSSRIPENLKVGLDRMSAAGVTVTSTEMLLFELLVEAGTDSFRKILEIVK